jgi:hypothetical protein
MEDRVRREERDLLRNRTRVRRVSATVEARRAWNALSRREEYLRALIACHHRMLGRTDILYDHWMRGMDENGMSQEEIREVRVRIQQMIDRDTGEADILMSWERFNDVLQTYDYHVTESEEDAG